MTSAPAFFALVARSAAHPDMPSFVSASSKGYIGCTGGLTPSSIYSRKDAEQRAAAIMAANKGRFASVEVVPTDHAAFKVGDGATVCFYSDNNAATVIEASQRKVTIQYDHAKLLNGANSGEPDALHFSPGGFVGHTSGTQRWEHSANPEGAISTFTLRKNGRWVRDGEAMKTGTRLIAGRHHHYDHNF